MNIEDYKKNSGNHWCNGYGIFFLALAVGVFFTLYNIYLLKGMIEEEIYTETEYLPITITVSPDMTLLPRYGFTFEERVLLSKMLSGDYRTDGDGEYDIDFQKEPNIYEVYKVLCVVMNRSRSKEFLTNVEDILLAPGQFHVFPKNLNAIPSNKTFDIVSEWCRKYDMYDGSVQVIPEDHLYFAGRDGVNRTRKKF